MGELISFEEFVGKRILNEIFFYCKVGCEYV